MAARDERLGGSYGSIGPARLLAVGALTVVSLAIQSTLLARVTILGVIPQIVLVVVASLAYIDGERVGMTAGFFGGLLQDLLLPQSVVGLTALVYTLVGYGVGVFRPFMQSESVWAPVVVVAGASAVAEVSYAILSVIMGQPWVDPGYTLKIAGLVVLYNTLLTPFVFPVVKKVSDRFRPERVYRF